MFFGVGRRSVLCISYLAIALAGWNIWSDALKHQTLEEVMSDITDVQNSLYINFTGIHALEYLFSVKLYEKWDEDEISRKILKILYS